MEMVGGGITQITHTHTKKYASRAVKHSLIQEDDTRAVCLHTYGKSQDWKHTTNRVLYL